MATGALLGLTLGCLAFPVVWLAFSSSGLAATVAVALAVASTISTVFGFMMPWLFSRLGYDPALGSGPVATVVQDTFSLLTYFRRRFDPRFLSVAFRFGLLGDLVTFVPAMACS